MLDFSINFIRMIFHSFSRICFLISLKIKNWRKKLLSILQSFFQICKFFSRCQPIYVLPYFQSDQVSIISKVLYLFVLFNDDAEVHVLLVLISNLVDQSCQHFFTYWHLSSTRQQNPKLCIDLWVCLCPREKYNVSLIHPCFHNLSLYKTEKDERKEG